MKLRDHPFVRWPDVWVQIQKGQHLIGETEPFSVLLAVSRNPESKTLVLATEHGGERYFGALLCADLNFAERLHALLQRHIGEPIREVADLDILREL
jgi:hypothetical protein